MLRSNRRGDAPMHRRQQLAPPGLLQIGKADRHDEKGFEPFAEGDHERLEHVSPATQITADRTV